VETSVPVVTALRACGRDRVAVDLDGRPWRVVPLEAVYAAGLAVGGSLDRVSVRALRRELRRFEARCEALRALGAREHTASSLGRRLADRGVTRVVRQETVDAARRAGLIDDRRFATSRAELLARRGAGDLLIAEDLGRHGVPGDAVQIAIGQLEPETTRAAAIIEARGRSPRTARYLAAKGFDEATLEGLIADLAADRLG
jgi:SOS response regulatory protein OraA/RecX